MTKLCWTIACSFLSMLCLAPAAAAHHRPFQVVVKETQPAGNIFIDRQQISVSGTRRSVPRVWFNPGWGGTITVATERLSHGMAINKAIFPSSLDTARGWSLIGTRIDTAPAYAVNYRFAGDAAPPSGAQHVYGYETLSGYSRATARQFVVRRDSTPPQGGALTMTQDALSRPILSLNLGTDAGSGLDRSRTVLHRRRGVFANGQCQFELGWDLVGPMGVQGQFIDASVQDGACHMYRIQVQDRVLNMNAYYSPVAMHIQHHQLGNFDYPNGLQTSAAIPITLQGTYSAAALYHRYAPLANGICGTYGAWSGPTAWQGTGSHLVAASGCYQYKMRTIGTDGLDLMHTSPATAMVDLTAPTGALAYPSGYYSQLSMPVSVMAAADPESGVVRKSLEVRTAHYLLGHCTSWDEWELVEAAIGSAYVDVAESYGLCYEYRMVLENAAGGVQYVSSTTGPAKLGPFDQIPPAAFAYRPSTGQSLPAMSAGYAAPTCSAIPTVLGAGEMRLGWDPTQDSISGLAAYEVYLNGMLKLTAPASVYTGQIEGLSAGTWDVSVKARDWAGNSVTGTGPTKLQVDITAPTATFSLNQATRKVTWQAIDDGCLARAIIYIDGIPKAVVDPALASWTIPADLVGTGSHTVRVDIYDSAVRKVQSAPLSYTA